MSTKLISAYNSKNKMAAVSCPDKGLYTVICYAKEDKDAVSHDSIPYYIAIFKAGLNPCPASEKQVKKIVNNTHDQKLSNHDLVLDFDTFSKGQSSKLYFDSLSRLDSAYEALSLNYMIKLFKFTQDCFDTIFPSIQKKYRAKKLRSAKAKLTKNSKETKKLLKRIDDLKNESQTIKKSNNL